MKYLFCFLIIFPYFIYAQIDYGANWVLGCSDLAWDTTTYDGAFLLDFNQGSPAVSNLAPIDFCHDVVSTVMSDSKGELLFFSAGMSILNKDFEIIANGDSLPADDDFFDFIYTTPQGMFFLPFPEHKDSSLLFYTDALRFMAPDGGYKGGSYNLNYSIINHLSQNGKGEIVDRLKPIIEYDTLTGGQITAVKHGNGRDWWVLTSRHSTHDYYRVLVTPDSIFNAGTQHFDTPFRTSAGQACFSPDGSWYARYNTVGPPKGCFLDLYNFDRCTGLLSNHHHIELSDKVYYGGVSISPNSRFVYVSMTYEIFQFDLWANDIEGSKTLVATYDGFTSPINPDDPFPIYVPSLFFLMQLANDGKIYISVTGTTCNVLHTIESPDEPGLACNVQQHSFYWPRPNNFGLPNMPNYALGKLPGSPCDTLGTSAVVEIGNNVNNVEVYPNPASHNITFDFNNGIPTGGTEIIIYNALGEILNNIQLQESDVANIDVSKFPSGLYFYSVMNKNGGKLRQGTFSVQH